MQIHKLSILKNYFLLTASQQAQFWQVSRRNWYQPAKPAFLQVQLSRLPDMGTMSRFCRRNSPGVHLKDRQVVARCAYVLVAAMVQVCRTPNFIMA